MGQTVQKFLNLFKKKKVQTRIEDLIFFSSMLTRGKPQSLSSYLYNVRTDSRFFGKRWRFFDTDFNSRIKRKKDTQLGKQVRAKLLDFQLISFMTIIHQDH